MAKIYRLCEVIGKNKYEVLESSRDPKKIKLRKKYYQDVYPNKKLVIL